MTHINDLQFWHCRYPLWGNDDPISHEYCGEPAVRGSYCAEHAARCLIPIRKKEMAE